MDLVEQMRGVAPRRERAQPRAPRPEPDEGMVERAAELGRRIEAHRTALGLTVETYGRVLGVSGLSIYNWSRGHALPKEPVIKKIERFMRIASDRDAYLQHLESGVFKPFGVRVSGGGRR